MYSLTQIAWASMKMNNELIAKIKNESKYLFLIFVLLIFIFKGLFYNEPLMNILRILISYFLVFVLPGFCLMYYWNNRLEFLERLVVGIFLQTAIVGITSYYLGLLGLHIKYHGILLPVIVIGVAVVILNREEK